MNDSLDITDHSLDEQLELVSNADAIPEQLGWLSGSQFDEVAFAVIEHPNTDFRTLSELAASAQHNHSQYRNYYYEGVAEAAQESLTERFGDYEGE